jgi:hypothetical protein
MQTSEYKPFPYNHNRLGSKPKITNEILDNNVASILNLINKHPDLSDKQLLFLQSKIQNIIDSKEKMYLVESNDYSKPKKLRFTPDTKPFGGKRRNTKRYKKNKKFTRKYR